MPKSVKQQNGMDVVRRKVARVLTSFWRLRGYGRFCRWTWSSDLWPWVPRSVWDLCGLWSSSIFPNLLWAWCQHRWRWAETRCLHGCLSVCSGTTWGCCSLLNGKNGFSKVSESLPVGLARMSLTFSMSASFNSPALNNQASLENGFKIERSCLTSCWGRSERSWGRGWRIFCRYPWWHGGRTWPCAFLRRLCFGLWECEWIPQP